MAMTSSEGKIYKALIAGDKLIFHGDTVVMMRNPLDGVCEIEMTRATGLKTRGRIDIRTIRAEKNDGDAILVRLIHEMHEKLNSFGASETSEVFSSHSGGSHSHSSKAFERDFPEPMGTTVVESFVPTRGSEFRGVKSSLTIMDDMPLVKKKPEIKPIKKEVPADFGSW